MRSGKILNLFYISSILFLIISCNQNAGNQEEHITYGKAVMLADESLFPIIDDEYQVFINNYQRAEINLIYKPQQELLQLFVNDSINVAIMARQLTNEEAQFFKKRQILIKSTKFAIDGIALITGQNSQDTVITLDELNLIIQGKSKMDKTLVFDHPKSSTVEYLMNLAGVKEFPKNIYALGSNKEVIKYVNDHPNAIGIISVAWMKRPTPDISKEVENLKIMGVRKGKGEYEKPSQSNLKTGDYPLCRDLYLINCQGRAGLGTGFASFLAGEVGQRIILKSGLAPDSLPSRQIRIRN